MPTTVKITDMFGVELAQLLADRLQAVDKTFPAEQFVSQVQAGVVGKTYTERVGIIAKALHHSLPADYGRAVRILHGILGPENQHETGMFRDFYWLLPVGKFVELYGLEDFKLSMALIAEVTKRNTGEYAVRPYIRRYPDLAIRQMTDWARDDNVHLRRLASEGLRPKLPWAPKLDTFVEAPEPVFAILDILKADASKFVQKSVANHITDYLKVNPVPTRQLLDAWRHHHNPNTDWIIRHATRRIS